MVAAGGLEGVCCRGSGLPWVRAWALRSGDGAAVAAWCGLGLLGELQRSSGDEEDLRLRGLQLCQQRLGGVILGGSVEGED